MEQLLLDAKRLMLKLKEDDNAADMIVTDGTNLLNRIKAMKQVKYWTKLMYIYNIISVKLYLIFILTSY